jgi:glycyl-tRNA synthetase beta subunit
MGLRQLTDQDRLYYELLAIKKRLDQLLAEYAAGRQPAGEPEPVNFRRLYRESFRRVG